MRPGAWLPLLGAAMVTVAAVLPFTRHPPTVLLIIAVVAAAASGVAHLLWAGAPRWAAAGLYGVCVAAFVVVYGVTGDAAIGFFAAASFVMLRRPRRVQLALLIVATVVLNVVQLVTGSETPLTLLATDAGVVFFAAIGWLLVSERTQRERADRLLAELEEARRRERESAVQAERVRMARELHDVLAHTLSGLTIQLEATRMLAADAAAAPDALRERLDTVQRLARAGLQEARGAVGALRGEPVTIGSIAHLVEEHRLATRTPLTLTVTGDEHALGADAAMVMYRVVQESLSNVRKHAPASPCDVRVVWGEGAVVVEVRNPSAVSEGEPGWGITGMKERAAQSGGRTEAGWDAGVFTVRLELPYPA